MYLSAFITIASLLAVNRLAGVSAAPAQDNTVLEMRSEQDELDKRAPPNPYVIPMQSVATNTWQGSKAQAQPFQQAMTDNQVKQYASNTWTVLNNARNQYVRNNELLIAVISVPGAGVAAGTIWHGNNADFRTTFLPRTPHTQAVLNNQAIANWANTGTMWHAEAVAAQKAEAVFGAHMANGRWPANTKIAIYGRKVDNGPLQYWAPCSPPTSTVFIPCSQFLAQLGITSVT